VLSGRVFSRATFSEGLVFTNSVSTLTARIIAKSGFTLDFIEVMHLSGGGWDHFEFIYCCELQEGEKLVCSRFPNRAIERSDAFAGGDDANNFHLIIAGTYDTSMEFDIILVNAEGAEEIVWSGTFSCEQPSDEEPSDSAATNSDASSSPSEDDDGGANGDAISDFSAGDDVGSEDDNAEINDVSDSEGDDAANFDNSTRAISSSDGALTARINAKPGFTLNSIEVISTDCNGGQFELVYYRELEEGEKLVDSRFPDDIIEHSVAFTHSENANNYYFIDSVTGGQYKDFAIILINAEGARETVWSGTFSCFKLPPRTLPRTPLA
jgi:hypothetical protein